MEPMTITIDAAPAKPLVGHLYAVVGDSMWRSLGSLYDYILAGNGVFLRAGRPYLRLQFQIGACDVRGLPEMEDVFESTLALVPVQALQTILVQARQEALGDREILFHLIHDEFRFTQAWKTVVPAQDAGPAHCRPLDSGPDSSHAHAMIELHSHHHMSADFSSIDDEDEKGFRIYAVIGRVMTKPEIRVRVGVHGYFWEIPASWVFELPAGLEDCNAEDEDSDND